MRWWTLPFLPLFFLALLGIDARHPYLNPFEPEKNRLAAEKILSLTDNVLAARHTHWITKYAEELLGKGEQEFALNLYRRAQQLSPQSRDIADAILSIEQPPFRPTEAGTSALEASTVPLIRGSLRHPPVDTVAIGSELQTLNEIHIVIVPIGDVPETLVNSIGHVIQQELGVEALRSDRNVVLPKHSRIRGLIIGKQWHAESLFYAFLNEFGEPPTAPVKYLLLTEADIYGGKANFIFSASAQWGAIISIARFRMNGESLNLVTERTAKQALCAILKSFAVPISNDVKCVTSYSNSLEQFDRKGNRPNAQSLAIFKSNLSHMLAEWERLQRMPPVSRP